MTDENDRQGQPGPMDVHLGGNGGNALSGQEVELTGEPLFNHAVDYVVESLVQGGVSDRDTQWKRAALALHDSRKRVSEEHLNEAITRVVAVESADSRLKNSALVGLANGASSETRLRVLNLLQRPETRSESVAFVGQVCRLVNFGEFPQVSEELAVAVTETMLMDVIVRTDHGISMAGGRRYEPGFQMGYALAISKLLAYADSGEAWGAGGLFFERMIEFYQQNMGDWNPKVIAHDMRWLASWERGKHVNDELSTLAVVEGIKELLVSTQSDAETAVVTELVWLLAEYAGQPMVAEACRGGLRQLVTRWTDRSDFGEWSKGVSKICILLGANYESGWFNDEPMILLGLDEMEQFGDFCRWQGFYANQVVDQMKKLKTIHRDNPRIVGRLEQILQKQT